LCLCELKHEASCKVRLKFIFVHRIFRTECEKLSQSTSYLEEQLRRFFFFRSICLDCGSYITWLEKRFESMKFRATRQQLFTSNLRLKTSVVSPQILWSFPKVSSKLCQTATERSWVKKRQMPPHQASTATSLNCDCMKLLPPQTLSTPNFIFYTKCQVFSDNMIFTAIKMTTAFPCKFTFITDFTSRCCVNLLLFALISFICALWQDKADKVFGNKRRHESNFSPSSSVVFEINLVKNESFSCSDFDFWILPGENRVRDVIEKSLTCWFSSLAVVRIMEKWTWNS
jgi:hypothetical protein